MDERAEQTTVGVRRHGESLGDLQASIRLQLQRHRRLLLLVIVPVLAVQLLMVVIRATTGIPIAELTRDPLGYTDLPLYKGSVSNLGVLVWMAGAAICLFTWGVLRARRVPGTMPAFLLSAGILSLALVLDDLYMLHEVVLPEHVGIPQDLVYATYLIAIVWLLVRYRRIILQSDFLFLALAIGGFGASVGADAAASQVTVPGYYLIEDGGKLLGIVSWTAYFVNVCLREVHALVTDGARQAVRAA